jgi:hypothetical protein
VPLLTDHFGRQIPEVEQMVDWINSNGGLVSQRYTFTTRSHSLTRISGMVNSSRLGMVGEKTAGLQFGFRLLLHHHLPQVLQAHQQGSLLIPFWCGQTVVAAATDGS